MGGEEKIRKERSGEEEGNEKSREEGEVRRREERKGVEEKRRHSTHTNVFVSFPSNAD